MFIPYKQLSRRLHKRIEKWLNLQSLKAKLLLCWSYYILVVVTEKLDEGIFFFFFCKKLMFWFCLLLQPFYRLTLDRCGYFLRMVHSQWEGILLYGHQIKTAVLHSNSLKKKSSFVSWLFVFFSVTRNSSHKIGCAQFLGFRGGVRFFGGALYSIKYVNKILCHTLCLAFTGISSMPTEYLQYHFVSS